MTDLAASDVTVTINKRWIAGRKKHHDITMVFGDGALTYPVGGVPMPAISGFGLSRFMDEMNLYDSNDNRGLGYSWDKTNSKIKIIAPTAKLIKEERVAVSTHVGYLKHRPAHIVSVISTAGTTTGEFYVIPTGETPVTTQVAVTFTNGTLTFLSTDAVTEALVTYMPLEALDDVSDLVVDESLTMASNTNKLANNACAIVCVYDDTNSKAYKIREKGINAATLATGECGVDFTPATGNTQVISNDTDDSAGTAVLKVTYIKSGAFVLVEEEAVSLSSEIGTMAYVGIPATGQFLNASAGTAGAMTIARMRKSPTGLGGSVSQLRIYDHDNTMTVGFDEGTPVTGCKISYFKMDDILSTVMAEVTQKLAPASQTLKGRVIGW